MSNTGDARVTRSVSRARSVNSDVGTVATAAGATSTRARGRRAAASPAPEQPAVPKVTSRSNRAYGIASVASPSDQVLAEAAHNPSINLIANAVTDAETGQNNNPPGLAVVDEEDEEEVDGGNEADQLLDFEEERPSFFSLQYWAPRGQEHSVAGFIVDENGRRRAVHVSYAPALDTRILKWLVIMVVLLVLVLVPGLSSLFGYVAPSYLGRPSIQNVTHQRPSSIASYDYDGLLRRIVSVEHHLKRSSHSFDPKPKQQINWFLPGWGGVIDHHLSSPIASTQCAVPAFPWNWFSRCVHIPLSQPHGSALMAWDDPGIDRWCAPRSGGKLQLTVDLRRPIAPTELVVEYAAKEETPSGGMGSAPREIELWIQIEDDSMRTTIGDVITRLHPEFLEESSPYNKQLAAAQALGNDWVPVGRWIYNIFERENEQALKVPIPLHEYGIHTRKVAVRVNSNWGKPEVVFTCINRLRLHGQDTSGRMEALQEDPRGLRT